MKNRKSALESISPTLFGSLFLGLVLGVLSAGTAGAISDDEDRLFRFAAHDKDNGTVRQLLAEGVNPNVPVGFDGRTAVHNAAKGGAALEPFGPDWIIAENQPCQRFHPVNRGASTYTWSGDCVDGKVSGEGRGVWVWHLPKREEDIYEGSMRDGKRHGQGTVTFSNGQRYEGEWRDDKEHGRGTYAFSQGDRYEGEWRDGKRHGRGTYTFADGARYEGEWRDDKRHGQGTHTFADGGRKEGEWRDNSLYNGVSIHPDGDRFHYHNGESE